MFRGAGIQDLSGRRADGAIDGQFLTKLIQQALNRSRQIAF